MLALRLGRKSGRALLEELTVQEWNEWRAVCRIHPLASDWEAASASTATLIEVIKSLAPGEGQSPKPIPLDFLVPYRTHGDEDSPDEVAKSLESLKGLPQ